MTGKLYVIGVGPGDPELLTLKAMRILKTISCICVPKGREEGSSIALSIVENAMDLRDKEILEVYFPMKKTRKTSRREGAHDKDSATRDLDTKWREAAEAILSKLNKGDTAFITLGDPTIYSTFFYLYDGLLELDPELDIEIVPGVSSITASSARAKISLGLGNEKIAILPTNYAGDLTQTIEAFDTVVLMKVHKEFENVLNTLKEMSLLKNTFYISRAGMEGERIVADITDVKPEDLNYFSMVIVKK